MLPKKYGVISAIYNVSRYLEDFTSSLDRQTFDHRVIEVILVDDGSTDDSLEFIKSWSERTDYDVTVLTKENGGQSSARNLGLEHATAEWVTFTDPDDLLDRDYFAAIDRMVSDSPDFSMVVSHLMDFHEADDEVRDSHPLRRRFQGGDQIVDIDRFPTYVHLHASSAFFRLETINRIGLQFDLRIRPVFEDVHFVQHYLLEHSERRVLFVDNALYIYRRRADNSSTLQGSATQPGRYTKVLEFGCLDVLKTAARSGPIPLWLQYVIIYELTWTLRAEESLSSGTSGVSLETATRFHELVRHITEFLTPEAIDSFPIIRRSTTQREALLHGYKSVDWRWNSVVVNRFDEDRQLVELRYHFVGSQPEELIRFRGQAVDPFVAKTRNFTYLRKTLVKERILWLSARGTIEIELDGRAVPLTIAWPQPRQYTVRPAQIEARRSEALRASQKQEKKPIQMSAADQGVAAVAASLPVARQFKDAWVLMDRDSNSHDNAEHLFRYLRKHRRDINAWFVVRKGTADWDRLKRDGYKRIIPYGSVLWRALCLNAKFIVSSHADVYVDRPFVLSGGQKPNWKFVFLQHGVTHNDLSRWLNGKDIAGMVTATRPEFESIVGDGSPYLLSAKEVARTGFPRHDRLADLARRYSPEGEERRTAITIMPTWRQGLAGKATGSGNDRELSTALLESDFIDRWMRVLRSERLRSLANAHQLTIDFMPHPNLQPYLPHLDVPEHVRLITFADSDVQEVLARSALVVTDYSSIAFDAAYIKRPVVYYQFDRSHVFAGGHLTRPGYFSYAEDGFGPATVEHDELLDRIDEIVSGGAELSGEYLHRIESVFDLTPGACGRVTAMIENLAKPVTPRAARRPIPTPVAPRVKYFN